MTALPFVNTQRSLVLTELIQLQGFYPSNDDTPGDPGGIPLAGLRTFAGNFAWQGTAKVEGQTLSISSNTALFSLLENAYGGNGQTTFALPDLRGRDIVDALTGTARGLQLGSETVTLTNANLPASIGGGGQPFNNDQPSLTINYVINTGGKSPAVGISTDVLGMVVPFAGKFAPHGYHLADGALLNISDYPDLYAVLGTTYGGNGTTTFALPDLRGRTIIGDSAQNPLGVVVGQEQTPITLANLPVADGGSGIAVDNRQPSLALHYLIAKQGYYPASDNSIPADQAALGEIIAYAGNTIPSGWALADGSSLQTVRRSATTPVLG